MERKGSRTLAALLIVVLAACGSRADQQAQTKPVQVGEEAAKSAPRKNAPAEPSEQGPDEGYSIAVHAKVLSAYRVQFTVRTNIPLPVEVMASLDLKGQNPKDPHVGTDDRIRLRRSPQTFILDGTKRKLPGGAYDAEVVFYPRWGVKNGNPKARQIAERVKGATLVRLKGSGESARDVVERKRLQRWVMGNVSTGTKWNEGLFRERLGAYTVIPAEWRYHEAYYFSKADMTILVNTLKRDVTVWRLGRASK